MGINAKTLPGILLCAILAIPCWLLGQYFHFIGSPIFAIILGIIIGSLFTRGMGFYGGMMDPDTGEFRYIEV